MLLVGSSFENTIGNHGFSSHSTWLGCSFWPKNWPFKSLDLTWVVLLYHLTKVVFLYCWANVTIVKKKKKQKYTSSKKDNTCTPLVKWNIFSFWWYKKSNQMRLVSILMVKFLIKWDIYPSLKVCHLD